MITLVPGGPSGVAIKLKAPCSWAYAESLLLMVDVRSRLRVMVAWSMRRSHRCLGNDGSHEHRVEMKWFLKVRIARSAALARCWLGGTI